MKSSYLNKDLDYGDLLEILMLLLKPKTIIEFGILEGFSLQKFIDFSEETTQIIAYDIFENFNGNCAKKDIIEKFKNYNKVTIKYGDFYNQYKSIKNDTLDIIHIDIANDGNVYKFAIENYFKKIKKGGILILEGGSKERDKVDWMIKYNKVPINSFLKSLKINYKTLGIFPSITIVFKE